MPQLILSRGNRYKSAFLSRKLAGLELGPYFLVVSLVGFVVLITVITLMFSTRQVTKGYVLNSLEMEHNDLVRETERQDMSISQVRSLNYIQQSDKVRRMVKPSNLVYINGDTAIAQSK